MSDSIVYDATKLKEKGVDLVKRISDDVNAHETFIIGSIPSKLKITKSQYKDIAGDEAFQGAWAIYELEGKLRPDEEKMMFYTQEKVNVFGRRSGGYIMEVEIEEDGKNIEGYGVLPKESL